MDLFRRNQKYIFWIVAAIIIPSFVLVWGVDRTTPSGSGEDFSVGVVNGQNIVSGESRAFQRRVVQGALGGLPLRFVNAPYPVEKAEDLASLLFSMAFLQDGRNAGAAASDLQVGTFIDNYHPTLRARIRESGSASRDQVVDAYCREMQITRAELLEGIRDWQTIGNRIDIDNRITTVTDETVYSFYSLNRAAVVVKRMHFLENNELRERAKAEIMAKPADELEREAKNYAAGKSDQQRYRNPSAWRFGWILVPYVSSSDMQISDAEIEQAYEAGKLSYFAGRSLADVTDLIRSAITRQEVERQTRRNFSVDVDPQLRAQKDMAPEDLVKLAQLAKHGVVVGDTGPELRAPADTVKALPEGTSLEFAGGLEVLDSYAPSIRDSILASLKDGYNLGAPLYISDKGLFRLRLIEYQPSTPMDLDGPDGKINPVVYETALSDMVGERAAEMARQDAAEMEAKILALMAAKQKGEAFPDPEFAEQFEGLPTNVIPYLQIADSNYGIGTLPIGDVMPPRAFVDQATGERGQELIAVVGRHVPSRAAFNSEPDNVKARYRMIALANYWGEYGFTEDPAAIIRPSPSLMGGLLDRYYRGLIQINQELFKENSEG